MFVNISICHYSLNHFEKSVEMASRALLLKPNVKAFYRRSKAHAELNNFDKAVEDLQQAIKLEGNDSGNFKQELKTYQEKALKETNQSMQKMSGFLVGDKK